MPGELSSDMPGTEEFSDMSMEELGKELPLQGSPPKGSEAGAEKPEAGGVEAGKTGASAQGQAGEAGKGGAPAVTEPSAEDSLKQLQAKYAALENTLSQLTRENRSYAALRAQLDRVQKQLEAKPAAPATPLTPEQQTQEAQRTEAEKFLKEFMGKELSTMVEAQYGPIIQFLQKQQAESQLVSFRDGIRKQVTDMGIDTKEVDPIMKKLMEDDMTASQGGDAAATARLDRIVKNWDPHELILRALQERSKTVQAKGAEVAARQDQTVAKGGRAFKPSGAVAPGGEKKLTEAEINSMSEEERDKLPMDVIEKALSRQVNQRR